MHTFTKIFLFMFIVHMALAQYPPRLQIPGAVPLDSPKPRSRSRPPPPPQSHATSYQREVRPVNEDPEDIPDQVVRLLQTQRPQQQQQQQQQQSDGGQQLSSIQTQQIKQLQTASRAEHQNIQLQKCVINNEVQQVIPLVVTPNDSTGSQHQQTFIVTPVPQLIPNGNITQNNHVAANSYSYQLTNAGYVINEQGNIVTTMANAQHTPFTFNRM